MEDEQGARWRDWVNLLGRVRFGKQVVAGKTISGFTIKAVGERLAQFGNPDGTCVRPGIARLAVDMETTYTTVRNAITVLERVGLIRLVTPGNRNRAAIYRLVIGANLVESVEVWSPTRHSLEINRVSQKYRGHVEPVPTADPSGVSSPLPPLTPEGSAEKGLGESDDLPTADPSGTEKVPLLTPQGSGLLTPEGSATNHVPRVKYDQPTDEDPRTNLAVARASRADKNPQRPSGVDNPDANEDPPRSTKARDHTVTGEASFLAPASARDPQANTTTAPKHEPCPHGNSPHRRRDGKPRCPDCRTEAELGAAVADVQLGPAKCEHGLKSGINEQGEPLCFACRRGISA